MSDAIGVVEHAAGAMPLREHGYCTDDVARALVVLLRERSSSPDLRHLENVCAAFLFRAQVPDGRFHNRRSAAPDCRWLDRVGSDDAIGRALWALGAAARQRRSQRDRSEALACFERGSSFHSASPRANAAAILGAVEVLRHDPGHVSARKLLERAVPFLGELRTSVAWPWTEARLAYDNPRLPEARIAAGLVIGDSQLLTEGLRLLEWLVEVETRGDAFSFTGQRGWGRGEPRPCFDQQPIEAGAMADACARAYDATREERWADACVRAAEWFLGRNDTGVPLVDFETGGCADGLEPHGRNENQGAESTLAMISAFQHARRLQALTRAVRSGATSTVAAPT